MRVRNRLDVLIRNGILVDGSGQPRRRADVGVIGDRIVGVGSIDGTADLIIDAKGKIVSPGFVDPHSHSDMTLHVNRDAHSTIRQGVTTEIVGNCGMSNAPVTDRSVKAATSRMRAFGSGDVKWRTFDEYLSDVESDGVAQNLAFLVGHSTIREAAGVGSRRPSEGDLRSMGELVRESMEAGALGMSTGLEYKDGRNADTTELLRLTNIVGAYGGYYTSHIRNRDSQILESVDEFLQIVRTANVAGQISHLNVRHDTNAPVDGWHRAVEQMVRARSQGLDVQADTTPFQQGLGDATGILPQWLLLDGYAAAARRLSDPETRQRVRADSDRYWRFVHKGQWGRVRLQNSPQFPEFAGQTFRDIAESRRQDPWDSYFDILAAAGAEMNSIYFVGDLFTEEHLADTISHPLFSLGVDTWSSVDKGPLSNLTQSPLPYAGHVRYLAYHVRDRATLGLEEAVHKMSAMPAARFGLTGRGLVREGYFADVVVFDYKSLHSDSTFENPCVYPEGISAVFVNGAVAVLDNKRTNTRFGRVLRHAI